MTKIKKVFSSQFKFIIFLFVVTRIGLTIIGVSSRTFFFPYTSRWYEWNYSNRPWLDIWSVWDSGWYLDIAQNGYSEKLLSDLPKKTCCQQANIGFFPLYPFLMRLLGFLVGDIYLSGLII